MEAVERRARLAITGLAINANLGLETSPQNIRFGREFIARVAEKSGLKVAFEAGLEPVLEALPEALAAFAHPPLSYPGMDEVE